MTSPTAAATPAPAAQSEQKLTAQELEQARKFLGQTRNAIVGATRGLSDAQWRFKPAPDRWSIGENLDHVVIVQERVLGPILDQIAEAPAPAAGRDYEQVDKIVINQFPTRLDKFKAPEFVHPAGQINPSELLIAWPPITRGSRRPSSRGRGSASTSCRRHRSKPSRTAPMRPWTDTNGFWPRPRTRNGMPSRCWK